VERFGNYLSQVKLNFERACLIIRSYIDDVHLHASKDDSNSFRSQDMTELQRGGSCGVTLTLSPEGIRDVRVKGVQVHCDSTFRKQMTYVRADCCLKKVLCS
jgi:hypothetical protein